MGPKFAGRLHVFVGDSDNFFLNNGVHKLQDWMKTTQDPHYEGYFVYGAMRGHCYSGPENAADRLKDMAQYTLSRMPAGAVAEWWKN